VSDASQELIRDIRVIRGFPNFSRNTRANLAQYISERPEMTPKPFGAKEGQTTNKENQI
jgi:hypothetical protein